MTLLSGNIEGVYNYGTIQRTSAQGKREEGDNHVSRMDQLGGHGWMDNQQRTSSEGVRMYSNRVNGIADTQDVFGNRANQTGDLLANTKSFAAGQVGRLLGG
ncbi:hypothetical protein GCM10009745_38460 [Kribbella yunnanensis]|uniref:Uncharacterized protein n=1 Tax=Kribbella yunnanensis TaxID=190194 RepID=A0ABP4TKC3_9ACTN